MGKFVSGHQNCEQYVKQNYNQYGYNMVLGNNPFACNYGNNSDYMIQYLLTGFLPQIAFSGIEALDRRTDNCGGGSSRKQDKEDDNSEEIAALQGQINDLLKNEGVNSISGLTTKICEQENIISTSTKTIGSIDAQIKEKQNLKDGDDGYSTKDDDIVALKAKKEEEQAKIDKANLEIVRLNTVKGNLEELKREIDRLEGEKSDVNYDVGQEIDDIKNFMTKLNAFKENPNKDTAQALQNALGNGGNDSIDNPTIKKAYDLIKEQVEKCLSE